MAGVILGIDTSSALTSVAMIADAGEVLLSREHLDPRRHAEVIGPLLAEVVAGAPRATVVACGVGPGPYTGLRVGIATALALGVAWGVPVHGLCSLDAVAAEALAKRPGQPVTVAVDARRSEVYWASYDSEGRRVTGPRVGPADASQGAVTSHPHAVWVARQVQDLLRAGRVPTEIDAPLDAHGTDTGATAQALAGADLLLPRPLYLRRPDAVAALP